MPTPNQRGARPVDRWRPRNCRNALNLPRSARDGVVMMFELQVPTVRTSFQTFQGGAPRRHLHGALCAERGSEPNNATEKKKPLNKGPNRMTSQKGRARPRRIRFGPLAFDGEFGSGRAARGAYCADRRAPKGRAVRDVGVDLSFAPRLDGPRAVARGPLDGRDRIDGMNDERM